MNKQTSIKPPDGDALQARATRAGTEPASSLGHSAGIAIADLSPKATLTHCIHGLNLAARQIDGLGGDGSQFRELAAEAQCARWAA